MRLEVNEDGLAVKGGTFSQSVVALIYAAGKQRLKQLRNRYSCGRSKANERKAFNE